jgi:phage shock protein A
MLKARAQAAKANEQLQSAVGALGTSTAMGAFERMEEKVLQMEARGQAAAEIAGADLESQFAALESGGDVDDELEAMKAQLLSGSSTNQALPAGAPASASGGAPATSTPAAPKDAAVDAELEDLKRQLDQL